MWSRKCSIVRVLCLSRKNRRPRCPLRHLSAAILRTVRSWARAYLDSKRDLVRSKEYRAFRNLQCLHRGVITAVRNIDAHSDILHSLNDFCTKVRQSLVIVIKASSGNMIALIVAKLTKPSVRDRNAD